jgi:hypothetical protein
MDVLPIAFSGEVAFSASVQGMAGENNVLSRAFDVKAGATERLARASAAQAYRWSSA